MKLRCIVLAALALQAGAAMAGDAAPALGRYLPRYPAIYYTVGYVQDDRDTSYDQSGADRDSASPTVPGKSAYPEQRVDATFISYFPLFEDLGIPFVSSRLHSARMTLHYGKTRTQGAMGDYLATNPEFAPSSKSETSGVGDISFELASFVLGGQDWRTRKDNPLAVMVALGLDMPVGNYEQTAPMTIGSNRLASGASFGVHWRPWHGGIVEGGAGLRAYGENPNANFGRLAPAQQGTDKLLNLSVAQRVFAGGFAGIFLTDRRGAPNEYRHIHYAPNAPAPNPAPQGGTTESFPVDGSYRDGGTALSVAGLSFDWFITQRLQATLDYAHPLSGKSGQMPVAFRQRQCPAGSQPGASSCTEADQGEVLVDGQGSARSFSSDSLSLSFSYNFGHADLYSCTGCEQ